MMSKVKLTNKKQTKELKCLNVNAVQVQWKKENRLKYVFLFIDIFYSLGIILQVNEKKKDQSKNFE